MSATAAIILRRAPYRESDVIVSAYTRREGKISLVAKGAKKISSKLAGHLEPLTLSDIMVIPGKGLPYAASALTRDAFLDIREDLDKLSCAGQALRWFDRLVRDGQPDERLFGLLSRWLEIVDSYPASCFNAANGELLFCFFALRLLAELGYRPQLSSCLACGLGLRPGKNYFNLRSGGIICAECLIKKQAQGRYQGQEANELMPVSDNCIKLMRLLLNERLAALKAMKLGKKLIRELGVLTRRYLEYQS